MSIWVKIAKSLDEKESLFYARHQVFVNDDCLLKSSEDNRITDSYDALHTTINFIVLDDMQVIGGVRLTKWSCYGSPADQFFDFSSLVPYFGECVATLGMFFIKGKYRHSRRIIFHLFNVVFLLSINNNVKCLVAAVNPCIERLLIRIGFLAVNEPFKHLANGIDVLPMIMDITNRKKMLISRHSDRLCDLKLNDSYYHLFARPNDVIVKGDFGRKIQWNLISGEIQLDKSSANLTKPGCIITAKSIRSQSNTHIMIYE